MKNALACLLLVSGCLPTIGSGLPTGRTLARVRSLSDPQQDFAIYLPHAFTPARRWPIVFGFSPEGRGADVVELMRDAAERHGYVVLASNQAHNGPLPPI